MNTDVKCSIKEASSNELLYQIEVHNGLIPAYIVKKRDGPIPYIHRIVGCSRKIRSLHFFLLQFLSLEAASKPALKPAARLILKDFLFLLQVRMVENRSCNRGAFFPSCRKRAVLRQLCCRPSGFDLLGMCNTSGSHGMKTDSV